jgi:hypothetical protein
MSDLESKAAEAPALYSEPLLPIEKTLIGWSLGLGLALLIVLAIVNKVLLAS